MSPRRMREEGISVCSDRMRVANCSADISSEKKPTMPPETVSIEPSGLRPAAIFDRDVIGDVGRQRRFAHGRAAREDDEVRRLHPAHQLIEVDHAGGQAREMPVALVGLAREVDRVLERVGEAQEALVVAPGLRQLVEPPLGVLDLLAGFDIDRRVIGEVDHVLADADQIAPDRQVIDGTPVILRVDDRGRLGREPGKILRGREPGDVGVGGQEGLERDRGRDLAGADQAGGDLEHLLVDRLEEVFRLEEVGDPVEGVVVDQDRADQGLLDLDVVRRVPVFVRRLGVGFAQGGFESHCLPSRSSYACARAIGIARVRTRLNKRIENHAQFT